MTMIAKQLTLLFLGIVFIAFSLCAQESAAKTAFKAKNDSVYKAWQAEYKAKAMERRLAFLLQIDTIASDSLTVLTARNMELERLPDLSRFTRLRRIQLEGHALNQLPKSTFIADSLTHIIIGNSKLERIHFRKSHAIKAVSLHHNQLRRFPRSIRKLKNLQSLNLENNQIKHIPRFVKRMDSLKDINLNHNQIQLTRRSIRRLAHIEAVSLGANKLTKLPENIGKLNGTKSLNLGKNSIGYLPKSFSKLQKLEQIIFYENKFTDFPDAILHLESLKHIDFYRNQLATLPDGLGELKHLEQLFVSYNQLETLPESLQHLDRLVYLYAHNNRLLVFPEWIAQHKKLQRLGFSNNRIIHLPDVSFMPALTDLSVENNLIDRFPWELMEKEGLLLLNLKNNAFNLDSTDKEKLKIINERLKKNGTVLIL